MIEVKTFGSYALTYNGQSLLGKNYRGGDSQYVRLLQILLHNKDKGVDRKEVEKLLFGDRDVENVPHALQSVIYNAKRSLEKVGLPKLTYIEIREGKVQWTPQIPVKEDAAEMEELYHKVKITKNQEKSINLLDQIIHMYTGEFLAGDGRHLWVAAEQKKYRGIFEDCVQRCYEIYQKNKDYKQMEQLGRYAAVVEPFADWEVITMEALTSMGRKEEASAFYEETVDWYLKEKGFRPSSRLTEVLDSLGSTMIHTYEELEEIQQQMLEDDYEAVEDAYLCTWPIFRGIYQYLMRSRERSNQPVYVMSCVVVDSKGNPMDDGVHLEELSNRLGKAILSSIRKSDVVNHYSKGQYIILLVNTKRESIPTIQKRISLNFLTGRQRTGVRYYVNSALPDEGMDCIQ